MGPEYENDPDVVIKAVAAPVVPTQVAEPARASWRTAVVAVITALPLVNLAFLGLQGILADYGYTVDSMPAWAWGILNGAVIISGILAKWINSIMLMPKVNEWLTERNMGPTPKIEG